MGHNMYVNSFKYNEGPIVYFNACRNETVLEANNRVGTYKSINNFLIDSYIFHRRHREESISTSARLAYRDTFVYLCRIKNDLPLVERKMTDYGF